MSDFATSNTSTISNARRTTGRKHAPNYALTGEAVVIRGHMGVPDRNGSYSLTLVMDKNSPEIANINNAIRAAATDGIRARWKGRKPETLALPLKDGDDGYYGDDALGKFVLTAKTRKTPEVFAPTQPLSRINPESLDGAGAIVRAAVTFSAYEVEGRCGVCAWLGNVLYLGQTECTGMTRSAESDFNELFESGTVQAVKNLESLGLANETYDIPF